MTRSGALIGAVLALFLAGAGEAPPPAATVQGSAANVPGSAGSLPSSEIDRRISMLLYAPRILETSGRLSILLTISSRVTSLI